MKRFWLILILIGLALPGQAAAQDGGEAQVQALLFYSPSCGHCHEVMDEVLPPLQTQYGSQLEILEIDATKEAGANLYRTAVTRFQIPEDRLGVPMMIVGETVLVGSFEIPQRLPGLIEAGLAQGGIEWPDLPNLPAPTPASAAPAVEAEAEAAAPSPDLMMPAVPSLEQLAVASAAEEPEPDPVGFALAWVILVGLVLALLAAGWRLLRGWSLWFLPEETAVPSVRTWIVPLLAVIGLGIAAYLAYVEMTPAAPMCGPVGECESVQSSPYAQLFGVPVAVWGLLFYGAVLGAWGISLRGEARLRRLAVTGLVGMTIVGVLFSIYLTLLELFVIHAVCAWCLSSAVAAGLLMGVVAWRVTKRPSAVQLELA